MKILKGIAVSAGVSIGRAFFMNRAGTRTVPHQTVVPDRIDDEVARLEQAFSDERNRLEQARAHIPQELRDHASILTSHIMIADDPKLLGAARKRIREMGIVAEWALSKTVDEIADAFAAIDDPYIRERMQDVSAVADRIMERLLGEHRQTRTIQGRAVLMAPDLTPADTVELEVSKIMSFATSQGGKTSHTGILARSLQIPAVVGVQGLESSIEDGQLVVVDGLRGRVVINPDEDSLQYYADLKYQFESYQASTMRSCQLPGETRDGVRTRVVCNIELVEEVTAVIDNGGEGIGLYRTEFAFLNRRMWPSEEDLYEEYRQLVEIMSPQQVLLRTLDIGADKFMAHLRDVPEEPNPALGLRAIRYCMRNTQLFRMQLRAICRASAHGNVSLMFPMISGLKEVRQAKQLLRQVQKELREEGLPFDEEMPVGIMMELPSAVMIAEILAQEVDFFSIGTNDLIQYSLGIDRGNSLVSYLYQPLHPAVLRSIKYVVDSAHQAGIEVSVCGEMASDPYCLPILLGMQVDAISISPQAVPGIKRIIRMTTMEECNVLLKKVLSYTAVSKINRTVRQTIFSRFPEELMFFSSMLDTDDGGDANGK